MEVNLRSTLIQIRTLQIMASLERAGTTPIDLPTFHSFTFLVNVLSPIWNLNPFEGSVLKNEGGPYFPSVQRELDRLVGLNVIEVSEIELTQNDLGLLNASFILGGVAAQNLLEKCKKFPDEILWMEFIDELAFAFSEATPEIRDDLANVDASFSNPAISEGRVVDYAEWVTATTENPTWNTVEKFQDFMGDNVILTKAEKLVMYIHLLRRLANEY